MVNPRFGTPGPQSPHGTTGADEAMTMTIGRMRPARAVSMLVLALALAGPVTAQDTSADTRLRRLEAEVRAIQRKVFPGDGKVFAPEITANTTAAGTAAPASTPVTDLLARMDTIEAQIQRLTAQSELNTNRIAQIEARIGPAPAAAVAPTTATPLATAPVPSPIAATSTTPPATATPAPVAAVPAPQTILPAASAAPKPAVAAVTPARPATAAATPARPAAAVAPSAARVAAVRAIEKPATADPGDDEYSYGYRLWDAKFYPEAAQQLKLFVDKYPRHSRVSFGRNLLGRALLDDGKPREAAGWFLQNFQADKAGGRAPDSLLYLAVAMKQLNDTSRACIALAEFAETYPAESAGRLKSVFDDTRAGVKCTK
jgi:TolA-binding protein